MDKNKSTEWNVEVCEIAQAWCVRYTDHRKGEKEHRERECIFLANGFEEATETVRQEFPHDWPAGDGTTMVTALFEAIKISRGFDNYEITKIDPIKKQRRKPPYA